MAPKILSAYGWKSPSFDHAKDTVWLTRHTLEDIQLHDLCAKITPNCHLHPALLNGHLQTAWTVIRTEAALIYYKRRTFTAEDAAFRGHFTVDFVVRPPELTGDSSKFGDNDIHEDFHCASTVQDSTGVGHTCLPPRTEYFSETEFCHVASDDTKPLLIVLAGLSGGSHSSYVRDALGPLTACTGEQGLSGGAWEAIVVNSRGCAGSKLTSSILYNARSTWDIRQVISWAKSVWPNRPLFALGFSIGANILCNYLAQQGTQCELKSAVVVSNPWNLDVCDRALQRSLIGSEIYSRTMGAAMRSVYELHEEQISRVAGIEPDRVKQGKYLHEFDRDVQCPLLGYPTHGAYYRDASSIDSVLAIRIPLFAIHADDDPIAQLEALPIEEFRSNPFTILCRTPGGGHVGWYETNGDRWFVRAVSKFFNAMFNDVESVKTQPDSITDKQAIRTGQKVFGFDPVRTKAKAAASP